MSNIRSSALILVGLFLALYVPGLLRRRAAAKRPPARLHLPASNHTPQTPSTAPTPAPPTPLAARRGPVPGEVWLNGHKTRAVLSPFFGTHQVWLNNEAGGFGGPHTRLELTSEALAKLLLTADATGRVDVTLSHQPVGIGHIDECNGYAAVDVGPHTRLIEQCTLAIARQDGGQGTQFVLEGRTGLLQANSLMLATERHADLIAARGTYQFRIHFVIPDDAIQQHFSDPSAAKAMRSYAQRLRWDNAAP
jgi:hypothetical protein